MASRKRDIETRRKELQTQACQLLRDFRATEEKMNDEIAIYSKAWHLKFSAGICEKLPREIRDMIYDHLMFPHWLFDLDRDFTSDWYKKKTSFPVRAHYLQTDHVGEQMAKELAERIIRTCTFEVKSLSLASWLLRSDLLGHGILPKINIRSLRIHIQTDDRAEDIVTKFPTLEPRQTGYLEKLLNVRRKQGFKLCFLLVAGGKSAVGSMMLSLISFVYRFRKKGFDVSVFRYPKPHPQLSPVPTEDGMETWDWSRTYTWDLTKAFDHEDPVECKKSIETFMKWVNHNLPSAITKASIANYIGRARSE